MRPLLRLVSVLAALAAGALLPREGAAQRAADIPQLHVPAVVEADSAAAPDTVGVRFRITEAPSRGRQRPPPAPSTLLAPADAAAVLDRLPPLAAPAAAADSFAFPARNPPPPRTGRILMAGFPPADDAGPARPSGPRAPAPLAVVRAAPQGDVETGAEVTITFSQPMVPLSSVAEVEGRALPVRLSPQPDGRWRWLDVRTLVFTPRGRMPAATEYAVTIPGGTRSQAGGAMAGEASWTFRTPALSATGGLPVGEGIGLEPLILLRFDQRIDAAALLPYLRLHAGRDTLAVRAATAAEVQAHGQARALARQAEADTWIAVRPVRPLPRNTQVLVVVAEGAPSAEGPRRTAFAQSLRFRTYGPLAIRTAGCGGRPAVCRPRQPIVVSLSNALDTAAFRPEWVRVEPAIEGMRVRAGGNSLVITGATQPHADYQVHLSGEIRDVYGQTLGEPQRRTVRVAAADPMISGLGERMMVLDPAGTRRLSIRSVEHARLRVRIHRVQPPDWLRFEPLRAPAALPGTAAVDRVVEVDAAPGQSAETVIDLDEVLGGGPGQLVVAVEGVDGPGARQGAYTWVQATRMGLAAFRDPENVTAWATSLADGAPLPGVRVSLHGDARSAATDSAGTAVLPASRLPRHPGRSFLLAEKDGDRALLPLAGGDNHVGESTVWYAFTDRNLYRPGEEVRFKGWARRVERTPTGGIGLPGRAGGVVAWTARDAMGDAVARGRARLTAHGGFDASFRLPEGVELGEGAVDFALAGDAEDEDDAGEGALSFQVEEFRRPEYETAIQAPAGPHVVGGSAEVSVRAAYFAGGGLPGAAVQWNVHSAPAWFTPPGWGEWRFGGHDGRGGPDERPGVPYVRELHGETDADGRHAVRIDFEAADPPSPHAVWARATVEDVNRQTWTESAHLLVHPAEVYVGLRTERAWLEPGEPVEVGIVVVDLEGKPLPGRAVRVRAERLQWRQDARGWREVPADSAHCAVVSAASPARCTFPTGREGGSYRVTAQVQEDAGRPSRTVIRTWAWGGAAWRHGPGEDAENPQRQVRLVPDRETYAPGDTARILVQLPFWPARGVLSVRREGIVRTEPVASDGPTFAVAVPVGEDDVPNVHVQVDVVGARDREGQRHATARRTDFAAGAVELQVPPGPRTLAVTAAPADSVQAPGAEGTVDVQVRDAAGRPVAGAEVAVVMVDEAVLALTGFRLTNPVDVFYQGWETGVTDEYLRPLVRIERAAGGPGEVAGVVVEAATRQPLAAVTVTVKGTQIRALTDAAGRFHLAGVPRGRQVIQASRVGFDLVEREVEVGDAPVPELRVELSPGAVLLESIVVAGADGQILLRGPASIGALQARVAGVQVQGAGGAGGIELRTDFGALALWAPVVRTDAEGRARVPYRLPGSFTRYRVMAVAVSGARLYGMAESAVTARQPLMVRPSPPRFLNYGDRFAFPVVIQNQTDAPVQVDVAARGLGVAFTEPGRRVTVPARDRVEVLLAARAERPGTATVQVAAAGAGAADAAQATLPVYTPATAEAFATYGSLADEGAVELPLDVPEDAIPAFGGLEVTTSSTALSELTDAFLYLVRYPYECAEQIASRLLAVAALRDVLAEFGAEGMPSPRELADSVARDLRTLQAMQHGSGGFSFWAGDREPWPYVSVHATHALLRMRQRGEPVPPAMLARGLDYVSGVEAEIPRWYPASAAFAVRAYAAYVLDQAQHPETDARLAELFGAVRLDTIPLEAAGWLLSASAGRARFAGQRAELLRIVNNRATETASTATFATRYQEGEYLLLHSERRTDAVVLDALLRTDPRSPLVAKTVRGLLGHRSAGRWRSTQENAWVLLALERYFRAYEGQTPRFVARMWLGDRFAGERRFAGRGADRGQLDVPMRVLAADAPASLTVAKDGPGRLYYRAGLRYAPRELDAPPVERGFAVERTYEAVDDAADVTRLEDGTWRVRPGARVRVTVTLIAPARRVHVALVDPLPAGFEPVNPALRGAQPDAEDGEAPWGREGDWWWWGAWYQHQNLRDDRAEAFTSLLPAGVHTYSYVARATTPGAFVVPPPRAEEMYSPETFGRGATDRVVVEGVGNRE